MHKLDRLDSLCLTVADVTLLAPVHNFSHLPVSSYLPTLKPNFRILSCKGGVASKGNKAFKKCLGEPLAKVLHSLAISSAMPKTDLWDWRPEDEVCISHKGIQPLQVLVYQECLKALFEVTHLAFLLVKLHLHHFPEHAELDIQVLHNFTLLDLHGILLGLWHRVQLLRVEFNLSFIVSMSLLAMCCNTSLVREATTAKEGWTTTGCRGGDGIHTFDEFDHALLEFCEVLSNLFCLCHVQQILLVRGKQTCQEPQEGEEHFKRTWWGALRFSGSSKSWGFWTH